MKNLLILCFVFFTFHELSAQTNYCAPVLKTQSLNKETGGKLEVGIPERDIKFTILRIEVLGIDDGYCLGSVIPSSKLRTFRKGQRIGLGLFVKNESTGISETIAGILTVN